MADKEKCTGAYIGVALTSIALIISVSLNILLYSLRRKDRETRVMEVPLYQDSFRSVRYEENEQQNQMNPIYGNICTDGGTLRLDEDVCYEHMTKSKTRPVEEDMPVDVSYASLDLTVYQNKKKKRKYQKKQNQTHQAQTHPAPMTQQSCLAMGADCEVTLPSRSSSLIVSRSSIYLNSHQMALEAEEMEREREREWEQEWEREMENRNTGQREAEMMVSYRDFNHDLCQQEQNC